MKAYLLIPSKKQITKTTMPWLAQNVKHMVYAYPSYLDLVGASLETVYSPYDRVGVIISHSIRDSMEATRIAGYKQNMAAYSDSTLKSLIACFDDTVVTYPRVARNTIELMNRKSNSAFLEASLDLERIFPVVAVNHDLVEKKYFEDLVLKESPKFFNGRVMQNDSMIDSKELAQRASRIGVFYIFHQEDNGFHVLSTDGTPIPSTTLTDKSTIVYEDQETTMEMLWQLCVFKAVDILQYKAKKENSPLVIPEATIVAAISIPEKNFQEAWNMLSAKPFNEQ